MASLSSPRPWVSYQARCLLCWSLTTFVNVSSDTTGWLERRRLYWTTRRLIKQTLRVVLPEGLQLRAWQMFKPLARGAGPRNLKARWCCDDNPVTEADRDDFFESLTIRPVLPGAESDAILARESTQAGARLPDIICFSLFDWHFRYQRPQQMMSQFALAGHRVFYISCTEFQSPDGPQKVLVRTIKKNVFNVSLALHRRPQIFEDVISSEEAETLIDSLDELRHIQGIENAVIYTMFASWGPVGLAARERWGWQLVYDSMDDWADMPLIKKPILDMERRLVSECDLLVTTANRLYQRWEPYKRPMVLARNGSDFEFFKSRCVPNRIIAGMKHPVIGYYGAIAEWFDVELVASAARQRPQYNFVLVGGVFEIDVSSLRALPNVQLLGERTYESIPQYLYHFDVCTIPFKISPVTESTDPVKLYEYLSAGKPVVAVGLPELAPYHDLIYVAHDSRDFVTALDRAVKENNPTMVEQRIALAEVNSWGDRYRSIRASLKEVTPRASVIVVTYNNLALTRLCLESVFRNTEHLNYEVIVVDNNSTDGTPEYLRLAAQQQERLRIIINQENRGFSKANNQGIAVSTGEHLVLLNNDTIVPPGWLNRLVRHLEDPEVGLVGPVTNKIGNEAMINVTYRSWREMETFARQQCFSHERQVADIRMLAMFCVAMRRDLFEEIGPLDEQYGVGMFEDDDYSLRVRGKGYRVICAADVFVHHFGQASFSKLIEEGIYKSVFDENRRRFEAKWQMAWVPHGSAPLELEEHMIERGNPAMAQPT